MASVTLEELWLHDAADLSNSVYLPLRAISATPSRQVDVRQYAGGRQRSVTGPSRPRSLAVDLPFVPRADLDKIEAWLGQTLLLRDPRGRKVYGVIGALDVEEHPGNEEPDVSFTFREVSASEEV